MTSQGTPREPPGSGSCSPGGTGRMITWTMHIKRPKGVDMHPASDSERREKRRGNTAKQRRNRCHGHRQGDTSSHGSR
jgi:hypothetical protein